MGGGELNNQSQPRIHPHDRITRPKKKKIKRVITSDCLYSNH